MNTLPPLPRPLGLLTSSVEPPLMATGPKLVTVMAGVLRASTGTSPVPATLATWIVPAGAESVAPVGEAGEALVIVIGPPTRPRFAGGDPAGAGPGASVLPLTVIAIGCGVRNPKAAGAAVLMVFAGAVLLSGFFA